MRYRISENIEVFRALALTIIGLLSIQVVCAQSAGKDYRKIWATLGNVTFSTSSADVLTMNSEPPKYGEAVKKLEGKVITIEGYFLPLDFGDSYFVLSSQPYATCFFCGGSGPESVMEVYLKGKMKKHKGKKVIVKGKLELNKGDLEHLTYMLRDAEIVKVK